MRSLRALFVVSALSLVAVGASARPRPTIDQLEAAKNTVQATQGFVQQIINSIQEGSRPNDPRHGGPENDVAASVILWRIVPKIDTLSIAIDDLITYYWSHDFWYRHSYACNLVHDIRRDAHQGRIAASIPPIGVATPADFDQIKSDMHVTAQNIGCF